MPAVNSMAVARKLHKPPTQDHTSIWIRTTCLYTPVDVCVCVSTQSQEGPIEREREKHDIPQTSNLTARTPNPKTLR